METNQETIKNDNNLKNNSEKNKKFEKNNKKSRNHHNKNHKNNFNNQNFENKNKFNQQNSINNSNNEVEEIITKQSEVEIVDNQNIEIISSVEEKIIVKDAQPNLDDKIEIVGVRFLNSCKTYYFAPNALTLNKGDKVIVETEQGLEMGFISFGNFKIAKEKIYAPLKPIIRLATESDLAKEEKIKQKEKEAFSKCKELASKHKLDMKLVNVAMLFDESKIVFNFTSENRVDFRELVKDLALIFKVRIEMRQIGTRDEVRCSNCFGMCGQECCCSRFLSDYEKSSIKMAKNQNLALNPQKINGICGRLLCCLGYENEHYVETLKQMPKVGSKIDTPDGEGIVTYNNLISKFVTAKIKTDDENFELKQYELDEITIYEKNKINTKDDD